MKKYIILVLFLSLILSLCSCESVDTPPPDNHPCINHVDTNFDGKCDRCGEKVEIEKEECSEHIDLEYDGKCDKCNADVDLPVDEFSEGYTVVKGITSFKLDSSSVESDNDLISWEYVKSTNTYNLYVPSVKDKRQLTFNIESDGPVYVNGKRIYNGYPTTLMSKTDSYELTCGKFTYDVNVYHASKIYSMFINTSDGGMDRVYANKEHKEPGTIIINDADGENIYNNKLSYIKGRGNYSWIDLPKKPFNIKLDKKTDLLGNGKTKSYCLIANDQDPVLNRNHSLYDWSAYLGLYSCDSMYVDLYINNKYQGLYMITDKVEIDETRINIQNLDDLNEEVNPGVDLSTLTLRGERSNNASYKKGSIRYVDMANSPTDITGGYLLEFDIPGRYEAEISGFVSKSGSPIVVKSPEYCSRSEIDYISKYYQEFEDAINSGSGRNSLGKHYTDYIDVDSFVTNYIVREFMRDTDAGITSFFIYKEQGENGKLVCAPIWDCDNAMYGNSDLRDYGTSNEKGLFVAQTQGISFEGGSRHLSGTATLFTALYNHPDFRKRVAKIWETRAASSVGVLKDYFQQSFDLILDSVVKNNVLWNKDKTDSPQLIKNKVYNSNNFYMSLCNERKTYLDYYYKTDSVGIYYYANGGYGTLVDTKSYDVNANCMIKQNNNSFKNDGYTFVCWNTQPDGKGTTYMSNTNIKITSDIVLYAIWIKN